MSKQTTPTYISNLLKPMPDNKTTDRKVWSVPLNGVWVPFFLATNTVGETAIAADALGAPLRLQREQDGTPRFGRTGKPVVRVVKDLAEQVKLVRENFIAGLINYAHSVRKAMPAEFDSQVKAAHEAGDPIAQKDVADLTAYYEAVAEAARAAVHDVATEPDREAVAA